MRRHLVKALGILAQRALLRAADPRVGTWKFNPAKSKFDPGPPYKSRTLQIEAAGDGIKVRVDSVLADGKPQSVSHAARYDGKDYPIPGYRDVDSLALTMIDEYTVESTSKKAGKVAAISRIVVAKDGKTMTVTIKGTNDKGAFNDVVFYDKQ